jgi:hypothetical protein
MNSETINDRIVVPDSSSFQFSCITNDLASLIVIPSMFATNLASLIVE